MSRDSLSRRNSDQERHRGDGDGDEERKKAKTIQVERGAEREERWKCALAKNKVELRAEVLFLLFELVPAEGKNS